MRITYHALPLELWQAHAPGEPYAPESLRSDGFIHTTQGEEALARVLNAFYRGDPRPYVALLIDLERVQARWDVGRVDALDADVPHIHGPLNDDAILDVISLDRAADGAFLPPARWQPPSSGAV